MSYHTILKTSQDYTAALKSAREIAKNISRATGANVFPYRLIIVQVFESWTVLVFVFFFFVRVSVSVFAFVLLFLSRLLDYLLFHSRCSFLYQHLLRLLRAVFDYRQRFLAQSSILSGYVD